MNCSETIATMEWKRLLNEGDTMFAQLGITPIRIDLPFRLDHVYCFLAEGEDGWLLIDTGLNDEKTRARWEEIIAGKSLSTIVITHYHPDHIGYAGGLQAKTGASVAMTKIDEDAAKKVISTEFLNMLRTHYEKANIPKQLAKEMLDVSTEFKRAVFPLPNVTHYLRAGAKIKIGRYEYEILHAPGHSDGMVCFYNQERRVLLSADHILGEITPNITYWFFGDENPLRSYLHSLEEVKKLEIDLVIPSHGEPFQNAAKRIEEMIRHHDERLEETLRILKTHDTVYDICQQLFSKRLNVHDFRFAIGETIAHLEYLRAEGACVREEEKGKWIYRRR